MWCQRTSLLVGVVIVLLLVFTGILVGRTMWRRAYPYGHRPAFLPRMVIALLAYAQDQNGWFPAGRDAPLESLRMISCDPEALAGISGDIMALRYRLESDEILDSSVSSWQYFPGFRDGDPVAIIWERQPGIRFDGRCVEAGSHAVGFADGHLRQVYAAEWSTFVAEQECMREAIQAWRSEHSEDEPIPSGVKKLIESKTQGKDIQEKEP